MKRRTDLHAAIALAALTLTAAPGMRATAAEPAFYYQPVSLQSLFATPGQASTTDRIQSEQALNFYKDVDLDTVKLSGFMASRKPAATSDPATDYRTYLGLRYQDMVAESVQLSGNTFYGAGSYNGDNSYVNPKGGALPDDVRAGANPPGEWLGSDWQVKSQVSGRQTIQAGVEYRQPVDTHVFDERRVFGNLAAVDETAAHKSVGLSAGSSVAVASDLAVNAHVRMSGDTSGYDVGMTHQPRGGIRTGVSYAVQEISDPGAASNAATLQRRLAKLNVSVPFLSERFATAFEVQHNDVASALVQDGRRDFVVGNLTVASSQLVHNASLSFGVQNLFDTRGVNQGGIAIPFMPADGRSLRIDLKRSF